MKKPITWTRSMSSTSGVKKEEWKAMDYGDNLQEVEPFMDSQSKKPNGGPLGFFLTSCFLLLPDLPIFRVVRIQLARVDFPHDPVSM